MGYSTAVDGSFKIDVRRFKVSNVVATPSQAGSKFEELFCGLGNDLVGLMLQYLGYCPVEVKDLLYVSKSIASKLEVAQSCGFPKMDDATGLLLHMIHQSDMRNGFSRDDILYRAKALYEYVFNEAQSKEYDYERLFIVDDIHAQRETIIHRRSDLERFISSDASRGMRFLVPLLKILCPPKKGIWKEFSLESDVNYGKNMALRDQEDDEVGTYTDRELEQAAACVEYLSRIKLPFAEDFIFGGQGYDVMEMEIFIHHDYNQGLTPRFTCPPSWFPFSVDRVNSTLNCISNNWLFTKQYYLPCWLVYVANRILRPRGYVLNGTMLFAGETRLDAGIFEMKENIFTVHSPHVVKDAYSGFSLPGLMNVSKRGKFLLWGARASNVVYPDLTQEEIERMNHLYLLEIHSIEYRNDFFARFGKHVENGCLVISGEQVQRHFVPLRWRGDEKIEDEEVEEKLKEYVIREQKKIQDAIESLLASI